NRTPHYDQYAALLLFYFFNPILTSLQGIQQASTLDKVQKALGCARTSVGSPSEAARAFDPALLRDRPAELAQRVAPAALPHEWGALQPLTAGGGGLRPALPPMARPLWLDGGPRAAKIPLPFEVFRATPPDARLTDGNASERAQLPDMLRPGR